MSYHLLNGAPRRPLPLGNDEAHALVAGDGVYRLVPCFGMSIPYPLVFCEIRGLLPLAALLDDAAQEMPEGENTTIPVPFAPSYHVLTHSERPALDTTRIYQYVIAHNGVFLLAGCPGIEVLLPISAQCHLPGLDSVLPYVSWTRPLVGEQVVQNLFDRACAACDEGQMLERLFYLTWESGEWLVNEPEQVQTRGSVRAIASSEEDERALIEGHSHHEMRAYFSPTDDHDELIDGGFKVYFVIGRIHGEQPQIRTRVCVHGYSWEVPAATFFALPAGVEDCVAIEWAGGKVK